MSKRAIKLWAIVIVISILGVIATYVLLGNNGSSVLQKDAIKEQPATEQNNNISNNSTPQNNNVNSPEDSLPRVINASNNQNEYSLEYSLASFSRLVTKPGNFSLSPVFGFVAYTHLRNSAGINAL